MTTDPPPADESRGPLIRRRTLIVSAATAVAAGTLGAVFLPRGEPTGSAAPAPPPSPTTTPPPVATRTLDEVRAEALASAGMRLDPSPWNVAASALTGTWSALYATWLLRENAVPSEADPAALYERFNARGLVGTEARDGALIFYAAGPSVYHVGFVTSVAPGSIATVEGDVPGDLPSDLTFVRRYGQPWDTAVLYAYPEYVPAA